MNTAKKPIKLTKLKKFLSYNDPSTLRTANLSEDTQLAELNWKGVKKDDPQLREHLRGYQRLLHLVPEGQEKLAQELLARGLHSAILIAAIPLPKFLETAKKLSPEPAVLEEVHRKATAVRSRLLLHYVKRKLA